jgi:hypothetical protein
MRKFNKEVSLPLNVDTVAKYFASLTNGSEQAEIMVETMVGYALQNKSLGKIFGAALSSTPISAHLVYGIGQQVMTTAIKSDWDEVDKKWNRSPIGLCTVIEIDEFSDQQYRVEYTYAGKTDEIKTETTWVDVNDLSNYFPETGDIL